MKNFALLGQAARACQALRTEVLSQPEAWAINTIRQRTLACQRETESIFLRCGVDPGPGMLLADVQESRATPTAMRFPLLTAWLHDAATALQGEPGRALLARLPPGGQVYPHRDGGSYYARRGRYHLVLQSTEGSRMVCGGEEVVMREGECWWFDNRQVHAAFNDSSSPRVHLIFDLLHPEGLRAPAGRSLDDIPAPQPVS
ncbi:hypothetical protein GT347_14800 [Xylophilus rhododendri]|uniref:Aspartyl/asparaginy/proline hydroxylase domain-containing protein n=1 Tax=Xylophilus rhododendri TaxID=2697032 RepID=A0A857J7C7_9BURK|nr:aspartyl/asparaginyl beta-hydroxylase domain-containing protein [Xylophilus rhododendri]QHI99143.1 hypothetical protein GT347_14800 [Xylophilus rhododendri]